MQRRRSKDRLWCALVLALALPAIHAQPTQSPEVIVVTARLPGPELWKVSNDEHVLWIFAYPKEVPENLEWDSVRVERVLARAQEFMPVPRLDLAVRLPRRTFIREFTLPDGQRLADVLPAPVYRDYLSLKSELFPELDELETLRPDVAGNSLLLSLSRKSGIEDGSDIVRRLDRLVRGQRDLRRTRIEVKPTRAERAQLRTLYLASADDMSPDQAIACFAGSVANVRSDIAILQRRAQAWADGAVTSMVGLRTSREQKDYCRFGMADTTETEIMTRLFAELRNSWLAAVETALARNDTTVAVLDMDTLLGDSMGFLQELRQRGYTVTAPAAD